MPEPRCHSMPHMWAWHCHPSCKMARALRQKEIQIWINYDATPGCRSPCPLSRVLADIAICCCFCHCRRGRSAGPLLPAPSSMQPAPCSLAHGWCICCVYQITNNSTYRPSGHECVCVCGCCYLIFCLTKCKQHKQLDGGLRSLAAWSEMFWKIWPANKCLTSSGA